MTENDISILLKAQQEELDDVSIYNSLADACADPYDRALFQQIARDQETHVSVFEQLTGKTFKPKKRKAVLVSVLYQTIGKKKLYPKIARREYDLAETLEPLADKNPQVAGIAEDEKRYGDLIRALLN